MEGQKERNNSSPPKEDMSITRNGGCTGENGRIITSAASRLPFNGPTGAPSSLQLEDQRPCKKVVRYKECLKNYAAAIGGNATDGCGEFMPSGEQGTLEALKCSACSCHRNFHRKEIDGECVYDFYHSSIVGNSGSRIILGHHNGVNGSPQVHHINPLLSSKAPPPHQVIVSYRSGSVPSESDEKDDDDDGHGVVAIRSVGKPRKRFRTKFTEEQKQKMLSFAEKAGWKMQKLEESAVQRFCQDIGIKRRVLKVWMHNNKHNFAKKNPSTSYLEAEQSH